MILLGVFFSTIAAFVRKILSRLMNRTKNVWSFQKLPTVAERVGQVYPLLEEYKTANFLFAGYPDLIEYNQNY